MEGWVDLGTAYVLCQLLFGPCWLKNHKWDEFPCSTHFRIRLQLLLLGLELRQERKDVYKVIPIPDSETVGAGRQDSRVVRTKRHSPWFRSMSWHDKLRRECFFRLAFSEVKCTRLDTVVLQKCHNLSTTQRQCVHFYSESVEPADNKQYGKSPDSRSRYTSFNTIQDFCSEKSQRHWSAIYRHTIVKKAVSSSANSEAFS